MDVEQGISSGFKNVGCISNSNLSEFNIDVNTINNEPVNYKDQKNRSPLLKAVFGMNTILNSFGSTEKREENRTNMFFGKNFKSNNYILALRIPLELDSSPQISNNIFILETGSKENIDTLITELDQSKEDVDALKKIIMDVLQNPYPRLNPSKIQMKQLVVYKEPFNDILKDYRSGKDFDYLNRLYRKNLIVSRPQEENFFQSPPEEIQETRTLNTPKTEPELIDLSKYVPQSRFVRKDEQKTEDLRQDTSKEKMVEQKEEKSIVKVETEDESELEEIANTVENHCFYGKFVGPVIINDIEYIPEGFNKDRNKDYLIHPNSHIYNGNNTKIARILERIYGLDTRYHGRFNRLDKTGMSNLLATFIFEKMRDRDVGYLGLKDLNFSNTFHMTFVEDVTNANDVILTFIFPVDDQDIHHRPNGGAILSCSLPKTSLNKLQKLYKKNPDNLERFFELSFRGMDNSVTRRPVSKAYVFDIKEFLPEEGYKEIIQKNKMKHTQMHDIRYFAQPHTVEIIKYSKDYPQKISK